MAAFNGSGTFVRSFNWVVDKTNSVNITASRMDTEMDGAAAGLTLCTTRDGQGKMAADWLPSVDASFSLGSASFRWLNAVISGNLTLGGRIINATAPAFNARRTGGLLILAASVYTTIKFDTENTDLSNNYDNTTGIFTAPVAGVYQFNSVVIVQNAATGTANFLGAFFTKNNVTSAGVNQYDFGNGSIPLALASGSNQITVNGSVILQLAATDTIRVNVIMGSIGGTGNFNALNTSHFSGALLFATG